MNNELYPDVQGNTLREIVKMTQTLVTTDDLDTPFPELHHSVLGVLQFFTFAHLPEKLSKVSEPFHALAYEVAYRSPESPETTVCLRKLLEAKDAAVRAAL